MEMFERDIIPVYELMANFENAIYTRVQLITHTNLTTVYGKSYRVDRP